MQKLLKPAIRLLIITLVAGLTLGLVYSITKAPIEEQKALAMLEARQQALDADEFIEIDLNTLKRQPQWKNYFEDITAIYEGKTNGAFAGWAVDITVKGYGGPVRVTVGFNPEGMVTGVKILEHSETPGLGAKITQPAFIEQFYGKDAHTAINAVVDASGNNIETLSGASVSARAVALAVTNAGRCYKAFILEGGAAQ